MNVVAEVGNDLLLRSLIKGQVGVGIIRREAPDQAAAADEFCLVPRLQGRGVLQFTYAPARAADPVLRFFVEALQSAWASTAKVGVD
jgi:hypothetical protein